MIIAHRGFRTKKGENRIIDFQTALQVTRAVEFDIRLTKDKQVIIFHDADFKRIGNDHRQVSDLSYLQITQLAFFKNHPDDTPPLLIDNFVKHLASQYQLINVEIKAADYCERDFAILFDALMFLRTQTRAEIIVSSFDFEVLRFITKLNSVDFKKAYLFKHPRDLDYQQLKKFDYLHASVRFLSKKAAFRIIQTIDLPINVWTIKHQRQVVKLVNKFPNKILHYISDNPKINC